MVKHDYRDTAYLNFKQNLHTSKCYVASYLVSIHNYEYFIEFLIIKLCFIH